MSQGYPPRGPGGPAYNPQMMGGMPMMQQHSTSGFMNGPMPQQNPSYSPMPPPSQPHMGGGQQHMQNAAGGYANSPRGPHMMQHTGSHQGFQPGMPGGPFGGASPGGQSGPQHYPYNMQQRQMSSGGAAYPHMMTPRQQYSVPNHPSPGMGGAGVPGQMQGQGQGDEGK